MEQLQQRELSQLYGNKLRFRVCGICLEGENILMVRHQGIGKEGYLWVPPGGGMEFGASAEENLVREFKEETGLEVAVEKFLFLHEFMAVPLHAVEMFFLVKVVGGNLTKGYDPEMSAGGQIIQALKFLSPEEIAQEHVEAVHQVFRHCDFGRDILNMHGYFRFQNNSIK